MDTEGTHTGGRAKKTVGPAAANEQKPFSQKRLLPVVVRKGANSGEMAGPWERHSTPQVRPAPGKEQR